MKKIKRWFENWFLPTYHKEEIRRYERKLGEQDIYIKQLNAYIDGLEFGIRNQRRLVIDNRPIRKPSEGVKE